MKKICFIFNISLFLGLILTINSCSQDIAVNEPEQETGGWHSAKVKINIDRIDFDLGSGTTRAANDAWKDGDVVYLLLTDKDGNKVQAYVRYDAEKQDWGDVMYEGYKSYLTCNTERKAEAYFIDGVSDLQSQTLTLSNDKAVYTCTEGNYVYPEDGDMTILVSLTPITGRIRFEGASGTNVTVGGLTTCSEFSRTTGEFKTSTGYVSTNVEDSGTTHYIYSVFADSESPSLTITNGSNSYKTVFDASSPILKPGKSGFMPLPTDEDHRGWITIQGVTEITLDKTNVSLELGSTAQLTANVFPDNAYDKSVTWSSSNTAVATVDNNGKVTPVKAGSATITAQSLSNSNIKATCQIAVPDDRTFTVGSVTFKMKHVEAGTFQMGSTEYVNERPIHSVTITNDYYMGETEVTQALWKEVTGNSPTTDGSSWSYTYGIGDDYPAYNISYEDVQKFIKELNSMTGENFRMPTEAEWEFAARGGNKSKGYTYSGSNSTGYVAWYTMNSSKTNIVKTRNANELGIYDMSGNVREWCSDWFDTYSSSAQTNPIGPSTGSYYVSRGGYYHSNFEYCRCTYRDKDTSSNRHNGLGFRLAL